LAALDRGLPVLVEKPIALTSEDAWTMFRAAEQAYRSDQEGRIIQVETPRTS
jgi:predicted dehydrogenase